MKKVFIVDDELLSRQSLKSGIIWENFGYRLCGEAANGKQALELITNIRPDVIFTDIKMPVMDGLELLRQLKAVQNPAKIIVLSCYDEFDYVREALRLGAVDYLLKHTCEETDLAALLKRLDSIFRKELTAGEGLRVLRQEVLHKMIHNNLSESEIQNHITNGVLPELQSCYMTGCFQLSSSGNVNLSETDTQELLRYMNDCCPEAGTGRLLLFREEANTYCLIFTADAQSSIAGLKTEMKAVLTMIYQFFESRNITWIAGVSTHAYSHWKDLQEAYGEAYEMLGEETELLGCSSKILSAIDYMKSNYSKAITLEDIAEHTGISRIYLSQLFKKETGINISDFLIQYRLKKAKKLLLTSNLKVYTIAEMCGFGSVQYFSQIFKKMTGFSPYQFKDNKFIQHHNIS